MNNNIAMDAAIKMMSNPAIQKQMNETLAIFNGGILTNGTIGSSHTEVLNSGVKLCEDVCFVFC